MNTTAEVYLFRAIIPKTVKKKEVTTRALTIRPMPVFYSTLRSDLREFSAISLRMSVAASKSY